MSSETTSSTPITSWKDFYVNLSQSPLLKKYEMSVQYSETEIKMSHTFNDLCVDYSITVTDNMYVTAQRHGSPIYIRDLLGFQWKLATWESLEEIIQRIKSSPSSIQTVVKATMEVIRQTAQLSEEPLNAALNFLMMLMVLSVTSPRRRTYSPQLICQSAQLFFASRKGYAVMRSMIPLPHPNNLKKRLGGTSGMSWNGDDIICTLFSPISEGMRHYILTLDEMYVKPSIRYRGCHVIGRYVSCYNLEPHTF